MLSQLFMAKSAFYGFERKMQVVANNIANAQTVGYKKRRVEMESLFPLVLERAYSEFEDQVTGAGNKRKKYMEYGQGVRIVDITKDFSTGTIEVTNQPLDFAIEGRGMFQFRLPDGTVAYARAGNMHMDAEGNILNPSGHPLEPAIRIPRNTTEVIVNVEGRVFVRIDSQTQPQEVGQVMLAVFQNPQGLKDVGQNLYYETAASGVPDLVIPGRDGVGALKQRALEFSNVNIIEEMMQMMTTQKTFEIISNMISSMNKMLASATEGLK